jgi:hypothetical protein
MSNHGLNLSLVAESVNGVHGWYMQAILTTGTMNVIAISFTAPRKGSRIERGLVVKKTRPTTETEEMTLRHPAVEEEQEEPKKTEQTGSAIR